jgi:hypothetical protein
MSISPNYGPAADKLAMQVALPDPLNRVAVAKVMTATMIEQQAPCGCWFAWHTAFWRAVVVSPRPFACRISCTKLLI